MLAGAYNERLQAGDSLTKQNSITFGTATARRLSELADDEDFNVPSVDSEELVGALDGLSTQGIVMGGAAADVFFAVLFEVFSTSAVFIFDAVFTILKVLFDLLKLAIKSGLLQTLISIGIDFLIIATVEIALPLLIATIDAVLCLFLFFQIDLWDEQLRCADQNCFKGPNAAADWWYA